MSFNKETTPITCITTIDWSVDSERERLGLSSFEVDGVAPRVGILLQLKVVSGETKGIENSVTQFLQLP